MWRVILAMIPWEAVIPWIFARLTDVSNEMAKRLVDKATELVIEAEEKLGGQPGEEKAKYVDQKLREILSDVSTFVINLLRELAVAYAKKKGLIKLGTVMFRWLRRLIGLASAYRTAEEKYGKKWYKSKTLWVNAVALVSLLTSEKLGVPLSQEDQLAIRATINIVLRLITKEPIRW